eukprot:gene11389-4556_t
MLQEDVQKEVDLELQKILKPLQLNKTNGKDKLKALEGLINLSKTFKQECNFISNKDDLIKNLRPLFWHRTSYMRAAAIRSLKYLVAKDTDLSPYIWKYKCHYFLFRIFDYSKDKEKEKRQVLELMKYLMRRNTDIEKLPILMIKGVVSIAENPEDPYCHISMEILRELFVKIPKSVSKANGVKTIISAILDPKFKVLSETLTDALLYVLDNQETRKYIRPKYDLQTIIAPFTQVYAKDTGVQVQWEAGKIAICRMMRSWTGLICLCNESHAIRALANALKIPDSQQRTDIIYDILVEILRNAAPKEFRDFIPKISEESQKEDIHSHMNVIQKRISSVSSTNGISLGVRDSEILPGENITKTFLAVTILAFIDSGLIEILHNLAKVEGQPDERASELLQVLLVLSDRLISSDLCLKMHDEFDLEYSSEMNNFSLIKHPNNNRTLSMLTTFYQQSKSLFQQTQTNYSKLENVRTQVDTSLDEIQYQLLIKESNIIPTKDFKKWNWEPIFTLVYGPLRLPERLSEALKKENGKLIKRILSYYQPSKRAFCELAFKEDQMIYADLGCQLLENLLSTQDGWQFLSSCEFFEELKEILEIELSSNPDSNSNRILSEKGVASKLAREYFTMIGKLSSIPQGVKILQNYNIFNILKKLINSNRDDISQLIIKYLDYTHSNETISSNSRMILKEAMTSNRKNIRYVATLRLRKLLREVKKTNFTKFGIQLLQTQLSDSWEEISKTALQIILSNCKTQPEFLDHFISLNPNIDNLKNQKEGEELLLRMISTKNGFEYLQKKGWLKLSLIEWREKKIFDYVLNIELSLKRAMTEKKSNEIDLSQSASADLQVTLSPHFYGEITKTKIGCDFIQTTGHKEQFFKILNDKEKNENSIEKRAILWSLGQMASSNIGYDFINGDILIEMLIKMAENSLCLSFRGLCMYILSEVSKSSNGRKRLQNFKWEFHIDSFSNVIALPSNIQQFFSIPEYKFEGNITQFEDDYLINENQLPPIEEPASKLIIEQLICLGNPVSESAAMRELKRLRTLDHNTFLHREIVWRIFHFLERYKFSRKSRSLLNLLLNEVSVMEMDFEYLDKFYIKK